MNTTKKIVLSGLFIALGIVLPMFFHLFGQAAGKMFLPMHIPVLLCGIITGPIYGLAVGIITPLLSSVLTGMPPMAPVPMAVIMTFELGIYGFVSGLVFNKLKQNVFVTLISSMILGRIAAGITVGFLIHIMGVTLKNPFMFVWAGITAGIPGIVIQLVFIPAIILLLQKQSLIGNKAEQC